MNEDIKAPVLTFQIPTLYFRWTRMYGSKVRELEQKWLIQKVHLGQIIEQTEEWREIEEENS